jgi:hypothetical protein
MDHPAPLIPPSNPVVARTDRHARVINAFSALQN